MMGQILIALIALLHVYILVLEMFLWDKPYGLKAFGNTPEKAQLTKSYGAKSRLIQWFLGRRSILGVNVHPKLTALPLANFFLGCVLVAGIYGGLTASKKIIYIQALPAAVALLVVNFL